MQATSQQSQTQNIHPSPNLSYFFVYKTALVRNHFPNILSNQRMAETRHRWREPNH
jgi:hypothetical protein